MRSVRVNIYADEPEGRWHPLTEIHGGGPSWRWVQAGFLKSQTPSEKKHALLVKHAFSDGTYADSLQEFY